jgi:hypothetical protein
MNDLKVASIEQTELAVYYYYWSTSLNCKNGYVADPTSSLLSTRTQLVGMLNTVGGLGELTTLKKDCSKNEMGWSTPFPLTTRPPLL